MRFTEEHDQLRAVVRRFVEREINPHADEWEAAGTFPAHELFPRLGELGLLGLEYDPAYGGGGADHTFTLVLGEELGRADVGGVPMAIAVQASMATAALARYGSEELKQRYLAPTIRGELVCSVAVTEPDAGSDVAAIRTRAVRDGDDWVVNGRKTFITNGTQADWLCLLVRSGDDPGYHGMSMLVFPTSTPGFSVSRKLDKLGNHSSDTAELLFEDCRVPVDHTIGEAGRGFQQQMAQFQDERLIGSYMAVAAADRALRRTVEYLHLREAFGKPLMANQYLQYRMAELFADVDVLREYCRSAAESYAAGRDVTRQATVAKLKAGRLAREVADACVQFHGGMGYMTESWTTRYFRDARLMSIGGGSDEVMLRVISLLEGMGRR
jgi:citronellyl-CoA dehydrogenase